MTVVLQLRELGDGLRGVSVPGTCLFCFALRCLKPREVLRTRKNARMLRLRVQRKPLSQSQPGKLAASDVPLVT